MRGDVERRRWNGRLKGRARWQSYRLGSADRYHLPVPRTPLRTADRASADAAATPTRGPGPDPRGRPRERPAAPPTSRRRAIRVVLRRRSWWRCGAPESWRAAIAATWSRWMRPARSSAPSATRRRWSRCARRSSRSRSWRCWSPGRPRSSASPDPSWRSWPLARRRGRPRPNPPGRLPASGHQPDAAGLRRGWRAARSDHRPRGWRATERRQAPSGTTAPASTPRACC